MAEKRGVGRPRRSSRRTLEEAAAELFLEQTYDGTTVDEIALRAGVSRNTFFNYFDAKSDVLWVDLDEMIGALDGVLARTEASGNVIDDVHDALISVTSDVPASRVPWAFTQTDLMGLRDELQASGLARVLAVSRVLERYVENRVSESTAPRAKAAAVSITAAAAAAASQWANAGVSRHPLSEYMRDAIDPVCTGFRPVFV